MTTSNSGLLKLTNLVYGAGLLTSPLWGTGVLLATFMMNDSGRYKERYQIGCIFSLIAEPITLIATLGYQNKYGYSHTVSLLPLIPLASYIGCFTLFWNDKKNK